MSKLLKLTKFRKRLLRSCEDLLKKFLESERLLSIGHATKQIVTQATTASAPAAKKISSRAAAADYDTNPTGMSELFILVHATLIQEWLIFLDSVFAEAVIFCLKNNLISRLPSMSLSVKKVEPNSLVKMRESICIAMKEAFSFNRNYPDKIKILHKIFNVTPDENLQQEIKKQVTIRNIFQHNRGIIRHRDLDSIGERYFQLLDYGGKPKQYRENELIVLSRPEIGHLNKVIGKYSQKFEVLS